MVGQATASVPGNQGEAATSRQILERAMAEAKRIRLEALAAAEQLCDGLTDAARVQCDEMLAAARDEASSIVEAARREADRIRTQAEARAPSQASGSGQSSASMVLRAAMEEAEEMIAKAAEEAEDVRATIVADAQASALEIIRQSEQTAGEAVAEARQRLDILREQTKQFHEHLNFVSEQLGERFPAIVSHGDASASPADHNQGAEDEALTGAAAAPPPLAEDGYPAAALSALPHEASERGDEDGTLDSTEEEATVEDQARRAGLGEAESTASGALDQDIAQANTVPPSGDGEPNQSVAADEREAGSEADEDSKPDLLHSEDRIMALQARLRDNLRDSLLRPSPKPGLRGFLRKDHDY